MERTPYELVRDFVARRRRELGLNQYELAEKAGVSKGLVSMLEATRSPNIPKVSSLIKLAHGLKVDPEILIQLSQGRANLHVLDDRGVLRLIPPGVPDHITALGRPIFDDAPPIEELPREAPAILIEADTVQVSMEDRVPVPFYGEVGAGPEVLMPEHPSDIRLVPRHLIDDGDAVVEVRGDSMNLANIYPGMNLLVKHQDHAELGDIVLAVVPWHGTVVKRLAMREGRPQLVSESMAYYAPIPLSDEVRIVGVVQHGWCEVKLKRA
jgi:SOS-response transcriptional repressor LexA